MRSGGAVASARREELRPIFRRFRAQGEGVGLRRGEFGSAAAQSGSAYRPRAGVGQLIAKAGLRRRK